MSCLPIPLNAVCHSLVAEHQLTQHQYSPDSLSMSDDKGQIDEIHFWSVACTEQDIQQNQDREVPAGSKGLVGL